MHPPAPPERGARDPHRRRDERVLATLQSADPGTKHPRRGSTARTAPRIATRTAPQTSGRSQALGARARTRPRDRTPTRSRRSRRRPQTGDARAPPRPRVRRSAGRVEPDSLQPLRSVGRRHQSATQTERAAGTRAAGAPRTHPGRARSADAPHATAAPAARRQGSAGTPALVAPSPPPLHQPRSSRHDMRVPRGLPLGEHKARALDSSWSPFIGHARHRHQQYVPLPNDPARRVRGLLLFIMRPPSEGSCDRAPFPFAVARKPGHII